MKAKIAAILTVLALSIAGPALVPASVYADCNDTESKQQVLDSIGEAGAKCDDGGVNKLIGTITSILSYVAGALAIIMVILSGLRYITSGGDSGKVSAAKNALIYALIGIAIAVLAQLLVRFVITQANTAGDGCSAGYSRNDKNDCVKDR